MRTHGLSIVEEVRIRSSFTGKAEQLAKMIQLSCLRD